MAKSWDEIARRYERNDQMAHVVEFQQACRALGDLARTIAQSAFAPALFGWTSMHDLCIQQTNVKPMSGPYLRISPQTDGNVEFRYIDTNIEARQWARRVPPEAVCERFEAFLHQLRWIPPDQWLKS